MVLAAAGAAIAVRVADEGFYPQLTPRFGLLKLRAIVEWCDGSIRRIAEREQVGSAVDG